MVRKIIVMSMVVAVVLCCFVCAWRMRRHSCHEDHSLYEGIQENHSCEVITNDASGRKLAKSPRTGQMYWGIAHDKGMLRDRAYRIRTPQRVSITIEQSNAVARAFARILESYENCDVEGMKASMKDVPDIVTNMKEKAFIALKGSLCNALQSRFIGLQSPMEFQDAESLGAYLRSNIELTIFLGNIALKREDFDTMVDIYDALVLKQLLNYKRKYREDGEECFESCVDKFIEEWHQQIESENGFTRQSMWFHVDLGWPFYHDGTWSLAQLTKWVRDRADRLISLGYTPKWLSEFDDLSEAVK